MSIRMHSTVESVRNGDITVLAIVETILAISISAFIAVKYDTLIHIAVSACIAPLLLLRTEESTERGLRWLIRVAHLLDNIASCVIFKTLEVLVHLLIIPLSFLIKIAAAAYTFLRRPIYTVGSIPNNWKRIALCTDTTHPPELIPSIEEHNDLSEELSFLRFSELYRSFAGALHDTFSEIKPVLLLVFILLFMPHMLFRLLLITLFFMPLMVAAIVFSFAYRWSLKSTSFVYAPMAWMVTSSLAVRKNIQNALLAVAEDAFGKFVFYYSFFVALISLFKVYLFFWAQSLLTTLTETPGWNVLVIYLAPRQLDNVGVVVDLWHITAFINACLYILLFFYADKLLKRIDKNLPWSEKAAIPIISSGNFLRTILSLYTITCVLYVTIMAIPPEAWQRYSLQVFPW